MNDRKKWRKATMKKERNEWGKKQKKRKSGLIKNPTN